MRGPEKQDAEQAPHRVASGLTERRGQMDWKSLGNVAALVGVLVAMVVMFNQVNGRLDRMQAENNRRFDVLQSEINTLQVEHNRRFDALQAENNRRFDALQTENNRRFDNMDRRFDQLLEALRIFEGRITRLEEKVGIGTNATE